MDKNNPVTAGFVSRVIQNESTKRGLAAAVAGVLIAVTVEAIWPTPQ